MAENKLKGHLGLCRRAGKMSLGHDASVTQIKKQKAFLTVCCKDASERLVAEIRDECNFGGRNIKFITADITSEEIYFYIGSKSKVFTIDDKGFADMLISDLTGGNE
ncbi:MAG: hypothetical protein K2G60_03675 [Oscillospiraceae bacterium]|nr:hypothetical protein [Oscillospiraceae bacterium]